MLKILWNQANRVTYYKHPQHCHDLVPKCISPCIRTILECLQIKVKCQNILLRNFSFLKEAAHLVLQLDSCKYLWILNCLCTSFQNSSGTNVSSSSCSSLPAWGMSSEILSLNLETRSTLFTFRGFRISNAFCYMPVAPWHTFHAACEVVICCTVT